MFGFAFVVRDFYLAFERGLAVGGKICEIDDVAGEVVAHRFVCFPEQEFADHCVALHHLCINRAFEYFARRIVIRVGGFVGFGHIDQIADLFDVDVIDNGFLVVAHPDKLRRDNADQRHSHYRLVAFAVPIEHHPFNGAAAGAFGDHVEARDLDHRAGMNHFVGDIVVINGDVIGWDDPAFHFTGNGSAVFVGKTTADTREFVKRPIGTHHGNKEIVKHALARVLSLGIADDRNIEVMPQLYLVPAGLIMSDDDALGAVADHPFGEALHDRVDLVGFFVLDGVDLLALCKPLLEKLEYFRRAVD